MAVPFAAQCGVAIQNDYGTSGTFTKSQISQLTPEEWKALFTDGSVWNEMTAYLKTQFQMAACGIRRNTFYDWIMSSNRRGMEKLITTQRMDKGASVIQPFIMGRQMSVVNNEFWAIQNGWAVASYTAGVTGPLTTAQLNTCTNTSYAPCRVIRVIAGYGSNYSLPLDARYFLPEHVIIILSSISASGGTIATHAQAKVTASAIAADSSYIDVVIKTQPLKDDTGYAEEIAPTNGLVLVGINNVDDVESYCQNRLTLNPVKHVPFFYQTYRYGRRVSSLYQEVFAKLMADNSYFEEFGNLPISEMNKQDEEMAQREFCNAFLFQQKISVAQRLSGDPNWSDLDNITSVTGATVDPGTGGLLIAKRANMEGVLPQLKGCSRYFDRLAAPLDIRDYLESGMYDVFRARDSQGRSSARNIDDYMDSTSADQFMVAFVAYSNWKLDDTLRVVINQGDNLGVTFNQYKLYKPQGVTLNVIIHPIFDDIINAFGNLPTPQTARGKMALTLDLGRGGSIYPAILASNRREFTTGQIEDLAKIDSTFACTMKNPTIKTSMTSQCVTAVVECPSNNRWDENFSSISFTAP